MPRVSGERNVLQRGKLWGQTRTGNGGRVSAGGAPRPATGQRASHTGLPGYVVGVLSAGAAT
jgi:hypothetical protein